MMCNENTDHDDLSRLHVFYSHWPGGSAIRNFNHIAQQIDSKMTAEYDFGPEKNLQMYGSAVPPELDFDKLDDSGIPVALILAKQDVAVQRADTEFLRDKLPKSLVKWIEIEGGHLTIGLGKDVSWIYEDILPLIKKYNTN